MELLKNHIYNENCLDTMGRMPDAFIDLTITSPPYDNLRTYGKPRKSSKDIKVTDFQFEDIARQLYRVTKPGGVVVWVVGDATIDGSETGTSFAQALYFKTIGFDLFDTMIYMKPPRGAVGNNQTYWQSFEYMFILCKGYPKTIHLITDRKNKEARSGDKGTKRVASGELMPLNRGGYGEYGRRTNVWEYNIGRGHSATDEHAHGHPAVFPEKLARDHIVSWSNPGELVYDPMMGSGTVAKMSIVEGRQFIGSEINREYCAIAQRRIRSVL